jgi:hypothetical protein
MADEAPGYTGGYGGVTGTDGTVGYGGVSNIDYNPTVTTLLATTVDDVLQAELDILNAVQNRLNQVQEVWSTNYLGCELATLALISNVPKLYIDTPTTAGTASAETSKAYAQAIGTIKTTMSGMCMTDCGIDSRIAVAQTRSESWKVQGALRYEENRIQLENSNRLNDRMRMIAPGRAGVVEAANSMLAAAKMMGEAARQAEASKGDSGYLRGRIMEGVGNLAKTYAKDFAKSGAALSGGDGGTNLFASEAQAYLDQPIGYVRGVVRLGRGQRLHKHIRRRRCGVFRPRRRLLGRLGRLRLT